jgi:hypothetical protein
MPPFMRKLTYTESKTLWRGKGVTFSHSAFVCAAISSVILSMTQCGSNRTAHSADPTGQYTVRIQQDSTQWTVYRKVWDFMLRIHRNYRANMTFFLRKCSQNQY